MPTPISTPISGPLLATKLYLPPARPKVVARPRLLDKLNEGLHGKLTLISAPAGFGKTTLVSEWLASTPRPTAWLSLDEADSDPARFLAYLVAALQSVVANLGEGVLGALQSSQPPPIASLLTDLLNDIATLAGNFILVLDDYHLIDAISVDQALTFLLEHMPPQMHLVITTREDPQLPLARLRVRGQMTEVRAADLRFTASEAAGFLNQVMGLDLSAAEVTALETRTEGWIAGLQLAALSMRGRADIARFVKVFAGDNRYIVDYLIEEVLQRQPARVRSFLLQTSILERLSGPLCDAVTDQSDGIALLDALERGNLFVVPLDDQRHWFRYHHLFAEALAVHARQEQPAQLPIWHQRASVWYAANGLPADAIRHALAAKDFDHAAGLIEVAWPAMDGAFQSDTWLNWARSLPDELIRARPVLSVAYGYAFMNRGELEAADERLRDAERLLESAASPPVKGAPKIATEMIVVDAEQFRTLPASIATARAFVAQSLGDLPGSVKYGQRVLDLSPETDHVRRGQGAALLGLAQWASGDLEAAYRTLADAMASFQKAGNLHFALSVTSGLVEIRRVQGRLREAIKANRQSLQLALAQGEPPLRGTADLHLGLSELLCEQDDLEAALQHLWQSETLGEQASLPDWPYHLCRVQARLKETQGDLAAALDWLDEAEGRYFRTPVPDVRPLAAAKARVWVAQGRLSEARRWAQEQGLSVDDDLSFLREFDHITLARVMIAERAMPEAIRLLDRLQQAAAAGGRTGSVIEIWVLQTLAHQAQGDTARALGALERALHLAEPQGYVRVFVDQIFADKIFADEGLSMARLLSAAAAQGIRPDYIAKLLSAFAPIDATRHAGGIVDATRLHAERQTLGVDAGGIGVERAAQPPRDKTIQPLNEALIEPLSAREVEILHLIAQGLSNEEISGRLFLALSTVKGHNRNIFEKLQVQRRTEAVARARELGLL